jgi:hypothetical protein
MEKKLAKRKMLRRKYKHYAAAFAGAAIMAGTSLHGIPMARAAAAAPPSTSSPVTTEQTTLLNKDVKKPIVENDTNVTNPSVTPDPADKPTTDPAVTPDKADKGDKAAAAETSDKGDRGDKDKADRPDTRDKRDQKDDHYNHERYDHERWADREQSFDKRIAWYNDSSNKIQIAFDTATPIDIVKTAADGLGFDVNNDTFSLISQNGTLSVVRVLHDGNNYDITVDHLTNGNWLISFMNQIS